MKNFKRARVSLLVLGLSAVFLPIQSACAASLDAALNGQNRSAEHRKLDQERLPAEALRFFRIQPNQKLIEIWPGEGWYTEILAPYLKDEGLLIAALEPGNTPERNARRSLFLNKIADDGESYGNAVLVTFDPPKSDIRPVGGVDAVLTDGKVQTWFKEGSEQGAFAAFYRALKSGGVLGVINPADSGVSEAHILETAKAAGFQFDAKKPLGSTGLLALRFQKPVDAPVPQDVVKAVSAIE